MKKAICVLFVLLFLPLIGCVDIGNTQMDEVTLSGELPAEQKLEEYVKTLSSKEFAGRLTGTAGNDLAVEWLCEQLKTLGIAPYQNDDYKMGFTADCYHNETSTFIVYEVGGEKRELVWGRDFIFSLTKSFCIELKAEEFALVGEEELKGASKYTYGIAQGGIDYFFSEENSFVSTTYPVERDGERTPLWIDISPEAFAYLSQANIKKIHITNVLKITEKEVHNVVGKIAGDGADKGVVLTAHFDHMGTYGETYFPGALDNASGTATLLHIAELLKTDSRVAAFDFDIIVAFCNDEEQHKKGSVALAPVLHNAYGNLIEINIDCIGLANSQNVYPLGGGNCQALIDNVIEVMDKYEIMHNDVQMIIADQMKFEMLGIPSVSFVTEEVLASSHTNTSTYETLDYPHIANFSMMIAEFVREYGLTAYQTNGVEPSKTTLPKEEMPKDVLNAFNGLVNNIKNGEEAHFDDELISYMPEGRRLFTIYDYVEIDECIATLMKLETYHLRFIEKDTVTEKIISLTYMQDENNKWGEPPTLMIDILKGISEIPATLFEVSPIDGLEGFYSIYEPSARIYMGFAYEIDGLVFQAQIVEISPYNKAVGLAYTGTQITSLDDLISIINDIDIKAFDMLWEEYSLISK